MKLFIVLIIVSTVMFSCSSTLVEKAKPKIKLEHSYRFDYYDSTKFKVANFIETQINWLCDSNFQVTNNYWDSDFLMYSQGRFLKNNWSKDTLVKYPPQIVSIRDVGNSEFAAKILFNYKGSPTILMNLKILTDPLNRFYFKDLLSENLKEFQTFETNQNTFYYHPKMVRDVESETLVNEFNQKIAIFFHRPPKRLKGIVVNDSKQYCDLFGYDFSNEMTTDIDAGGFAITHEDAYLSYSGEIYYPHEIVHLYTENLSAHSWFNEGVATYFGGSMGCSLEEHLQVLAVDAGQLDFSNIPTYQFYSQWTNIKYAIGGLFVKLALEEYGGRKSLDTLLNSGKTEEDFFKAIKTVFDVDKKGLDQFIKEKLKGYVIYVCSKITSRYYLSLNFD